MSLEIPCFVRDAGDKIVFVTFAGSVVNHHVTIFGPPLDAVFEFIGKLDKILAANQARWATQPLYVGASTPSRVSRIFE